MINVGSDFSGVGAFEHACKRVFGNNFNSIFACDIDKFARISFEANHSVNNFYTDVYKREIPKEPLDLYMSSPPCQGFSIAGKRQGSILFFNTLEFIRKNNPRYFIIENVKGLLSHEGGKTFSEWTNLLGGKSINGNTVLFPYPGSVDYHIYYKVINSLDHGVAQNRERVFIVGIRDDMDNSFLWPAEEVLTKKLKDYLEENVDEKYYCSDQLLSGLILRNEKHKNKGNGFKFEPKTPEDVANCLTERMAKCGVTDNYIIQQDSTDICVPVLTPNRLNKRQNGRRFKNDGDEMFTLTSQDRHGIYNGHRIRRLTPLECHRLQDFPDEHVENCIKAGISNSQLYKQAGNSITVRVLQKIISKLKF